MTTQESNYWKVREALIKERGKCEICGATEALVTHHIRERAIAPDLIDDPSNLAVLCVKCHKEKHGTGRATVAAKRAALNTEKHPISSRRLAELRRTQRINQTISSASSGE